MSRQNKRSSGISPHHRARKNPGFTSPILISLTTWDPAPRRSKLAAGSRLANHLGNAFRTSSALCRYIPFNRPVSRSGARALHVLYFVRNLCFATGETYPRGLIDLEGSCPWEDPWVLSHGTHLLCRFPGSTSPPVVMDCTLEKRI